MRSLALGLEAVVNDVFDDPDVSNYLMSGFKRASTEINRMMCIVAFSTGPTLSCVASLQSFRSVTMACTT